MVREGATYSQKKDDLEHTFALVDSGVVIFTGSALEQFASLLCSPSIANCTSRVLNSLTDELSSVKLEQVVLRLELYSDILLALQFHSQKELKMEDYLHRLGLDAAGVVGSPTAYSNALPLLWESLRSCALFVIHVPAGKFNHLGTSQEVLDLLLRTNGRAQSMNTFSKKYNLQESVRTLFSESLSSDYRPGSAVNCFLSYQTNSSDTEKRNLVEHSLLSGTARLGRNCIVSHVGGILGRDLVISDGSLLQQVFLKSSPLANGPPQISISVSPYVALVMNVKDDVKKCYLDVFNIEGAVLSSTWLNLFHVANVTAEDLWAGEVAVKERALWNARLFSIFKHSFGSETGLEVLVSGRFVPASKRTITWLQDLHELSRYDDIYYD
jgi:hypothetical protein